MSTTSDIPPQPSGDRRRWSGRRKVLVGGAALALGAGAAVGALAANGSTRSIQGGVVDINTTLAYEDGTSAGTGMVLSPSGIVLTNNHVIQGASRVMVTDVSTGRSYRATVLGTDAVDDVALLKLNGAFGLSTVSVGDSGALSIGDSVRAIGNAGGDGGAPTVASGKVTRLRQAITVGDSLGQSAERLTGLIQVNARLEPGESGGPLVDSSGKVVGMNTATAVSFRFTSATSVGYAIPINKALSIAKQIQSGQGSSRVHIGAAARLGVQISGGGLYGGRSAQGALVLGVAPGSPAEAAGLQPGDTITGFGGQRVTSSQALKDATGLHHPGDRVLLRWLDQSGRSHSATVTLETGPPA
jgi:S1-C subfamily serine protease